MGVALLSSQNELFPSGMIILWSGATTNIPTGWSLCDGTNGTPDLRNKFVIGAGSTYAVGATGGQTSQTVNAHSHTYSGGTSSSGAYSQTYRYSGNYYPALDHSHSVSGTTSSDGSVVVNVLPPYYALCYIMKNS
jgi:hypothetical protein